jgi:CubicO group peptidase (beta-lactamase class C family)
MKPTRSMIDQSFGKLDAIVKQTMERTGVPGIALAVVFDDQVVYRTATASAPLRRKSA